MLIDDEFLTICKDILSHQRPVEEWAEIESDDMFQTEHYEGGFDATEMEFCFGVYVADREYWFQLSLEEIGEIVDGTRTTINVREAEL